MGGVKVGLQNTIGAIHMAETADMQNLIIAAGIMTGSRALFKKSAAVSCQIKGLLSLLDGVRSC